jgi:hypothetical protein
MEILRSLSAKVEAHDADLGGSAVTALHVAAPSIRSTVQQQMGCAKGVRWKPCAWMVVNVLTTVCSALTQCWTCSPVCTSC